MSRDIDRQSSEPVSDGSNMALMLICSVSWPAPCALYPAETLFGMCSCGSSRASSQMPSPPPRPKPVVFTASETARKSLWPQRRGKYSLLKSPPSCTLAIPNPSYLCQTRKKNAADMFEILPQVLTSRLASRARMSVNIKCFKASFFLPAQTNFISFSHQHTN